MYILQVGNACSIQHSIHKGHLPIPSSQLWDYMKSNEHSQFLRASHGPQQDHCHGWSLFYCFIWAPLGSAVLHCCSWRSQSGCEVCGVVCGAGPSVCVSHFITSACRQYNLDLSLIMAFMKVSPSGSSCSVSLQRASD